MEKAKFLLVKSDEIEWQDGEELMGMPGVQVKIIAEAEDEISERVDKFVKFPPGYTEPRHTHGYAHSTLIIEGEMHCEGKVLKAGDYVYGPVNVPHGPYYYPKGITLYSSGRGRKISQRHDRAQ